MNYEVRIMNSYHIFLLSVFVPGMLSILLNLYLHDLSCICIWWFPWFVFEVFYIFTVHTHSHIPFWIYFCSKIGHLWVCASITVFCNILIPANLTCSYTSAQKNHDSGLLLMHVWAASSVLISVFWFQKSPVTLSMHVSI